MRKAFDYSDMLKKHNCRIIKLTIKLCENYVFSRNTHTTQSLIRSHISALANRSEFHILGELDIISHASMICSVIFEINIKFDGGFRFSDDYMS